MGFSWQEHWRESPWPPPGERSSSGTQLRSLMSPAHAGEFFTTSATYELGFPAILLAICLFYKSIGSCITKSVTESLIRWMMIRWLEMTDHTYSPIRSTVVTVWVDVGRSSRREPPGNLPGSGGHSDPVPYPCLGNPTDRGAWWATVHGLAESDTTQWLSTQRGSKSYSQGRNGVKGRQTSALVSITFCCSITISE